MVFVVGAGHSGSTLLSKLLGAHPRILALSEIDFFDRWVRLNDRCNCGAPVLDCPFWSEVVERISCECGFASNEFAQHFPINLTEALDRRIFKNRVAHLLAVTGLATLPRPCAVRMMRFATWSPIYRRANNSIRFYDMVRAVSGRPILVDASKSVFRLLAVDAFAQAAAHAIYLTRDGRAVMNSLMKAGFSAEQAVRRWRRANRYTQLMLRRIPRGRRLQVSYEELCAEPQEVIRKITTFIRVDPDLVMTTRGADYHFIGGNDRRLENDLTVIEDKAWRRQLSPDSLRLFELIGGPLNRRLLRRMESGAESHRRLRSATSVQSNSDCN